MNALTNDDIEMLIDALSAWPPDDRAVSMISDMMLASCPNPTLKAKLIAEKDQNDSLRAEENRERRDKIILLQVKLIAMKNATGTRNTQDAD